MHNAKEPLKRIAHANRLERAARMVRLSPGMKVLDYGCGDGAMFEFLSRDVPVRNLSGFDPWLAKEVETEGVTVYENTSDLLREHRNSFDVIFCVEVCEHMTEEGLNDLFGNLRALGNNNSVFVFGVPLETGFSGLAKNIYRTLKKNRQYATYGRAIKALLSIPIPRAADSGGHIYSHLGFDWWHFIPQMNYGGFDVVKKSYLPWKWQGTLLNNEIYFICRRNDRYRD